MLQDDRLFGKYKIVHRPNEEISRIGYELAIYNDGQKYYYRYGQFHNISGPACYLSDGKVEYFINGTWVSYEKFISLTTK